MSRATRADDPFPVQVNGEVPDGWAGATLGDLVRPSSEKVEPQDAPKSRYLSLEHVESGTHRILGSGLGSDVGSTKAVFHRGDVLYGKLRPYLNKVCIPDFDGICSTDFLVFRPSPALDQRLLLHFLSQPEVVEYANHHSSGVQLPRVSFEKLAELEVPVPPLAEQKRIVAKVEELLEQVNAARDRLARVPGILKRFRQAVLAAACEGRLTEEWRQRQGTRAAVRDGERPGTWAAVESSELFEFVTTGSRGWARYYSDHGPLFLRVGNLDHDSIRLDLKSVQHVRPPRNQEAERTRVNARDILVTVTAEVGMVAVVPEGLGDAYVNQHVAIARPSKGVNVEFLAWFLTSPEGGQRQFAELKRGATKAGLGLDDIRSLQVPQPPLREQEEIVRRIEALLQLSDTIEKRVAAATARTEKLTQAILAKAFRGELVPTEAELARREGRAYEPAAVLPGPLRSNQATKSHLGNGNR